MNYKRSPWGSVQHATTIMRGVSFISTSSHGGVRIRRELAMENLPMKDILNDHIGVFLDHDFAWFEEDCACNLVFAFWQKAAEKQFALMKKWGDKMTEDEFCELVTREIHQWYPEFDGLINKPILP